MLKDNIASWTWRGYEGKPAVVDVYSDAQEVELFLNGKVSRAKSRRGKHMDLRHRLRHVMSLVSWRRSIIRMAGRRADICSVLPGKKCYFMWRQIRKNFGQMAKIFVSLPCIFAMQKEHRIWYGKRRIHIEVEGVGTLAAFEMPIHSLWKVTMHHVGKLMTAMRLRQSGQAGKKARFL